MKADLERFAATAGSEGTGIAMMLVTNYDGGNWIAFGKAGSYLVVYEPVETPLKDLYLARADGTRVPIKEGLQVLSINANDSIVYVFADPSQTFKLYWELKEQPA